LKTGSFKQVLPSWSSLCADLPGLTNWKAVTLYVWRLFHFMPS
jgi:hypothetical protein